MLSDKKGKKNARVGKTTDPGGKARVRSIVLIQFSLPGKLKAH